MAKLKLEKDIEVVYPDISHAPGMVFVEEVTFGSIWQGLRIMREYIRNPRAICYNAVVKGKEDKLGPYSAGFIIGKQKGKSLTCSLDTMAVDKRYRRIGIGGRLLKFFLTNCLQRGFTSVILETDVDNISGIRFYENYGFRAFKFLKNYYSRGKHAIRLKLIFTSKTWEEIV